MFLLFLFRLDWKVFICEFFPLGQGKEKKGKFGAISIGFGVCVRFLSYITKSSVLGIPGNWYTQQGFSEQ